MRSRTACAPLALSVLLAFAAEARAQLLPSTVPEDSWGPVGSVATVVRSGDTLYVGGIFDYVGPPTGPFAEVDSTGALLPGGLPDATRVFDACALPGGGWLVAALSGQTIDVRRIDASGVVDPTWIVADVPHGAPIACDATTLYLAGGTGLVAFDITSRTQLPWSVSVAGNLTSVNDLQLYQGRLYIQGDFTSLNGQLLPAQGFGVVEAATAAVVPVTPSGLSAVTAMAAAGDTLFLGGLDQMALAGVAIAISTGQSRPWSPIYEFRGPIRLVATTQRVFGFFGAGLLGGSLVPLDPATGAPQGPPMATDAQGAMTVSNGTLYAVRNTKFKAPGGSPR